MRETSAYDEAREEGRRQQYRKIMLDLGTQRFGLPSDVEKNTIFNISDPERLERTCLRLLKATSWRDLLDTP
jgi:hypothetical protein